MDITRQELLLPADLQYKNIAVIGAGAVGSKVCIELTKLAIAYDVYDFDIVEEHNISNQAFTYADVGKPKVRAVEDWVTSNRGKTITTYNRKFETNDIYKGYQIIFLCADDMDTRRNIMEKFISSPSFELVIDMRMDFTEGSVHTVSNLTEYEDWKTLSQHKNVETHACGSKTSVSIMSNIVSSLAIMVLLNVFNKRTIKQNYYMFCENIELFN